MNNLKKASDIKKGSPDMQDNLDDESSLTDLLSASRIADRVFLLNSITIMIVRLCLFASIWIFIFDPQRWYGVILFGLLSLILRDIHEKNNG